MRISCFYIGILILCLLGGSSALAQTPPLGPVLSNADAFFKLPAPTPIPNVRPATNNISYFNNEWRDANTEAERLVAWRSYYDMHAREATDIAAMHEQRTLQNMVIFIFVLGIVLFGFFLAGCQFVNASKKSPPISFTFGTAAFSIDSVASGLILILGSITVLFGFLIFVYPSEMPIESSPIAVPSTFPIVAPGIPQASLPAAPK